MKKEHFFLLIFIASAALVSGYTLAFASCYKVIMSQDQAQTVIAEQQITDINNNISDTESVKNDYRGTAITTTQLSSTDTGSSTTEMMVVSSVEKAEIEAMLTSLGLQEGQEYSQFIRDFQNQQSLEPTGYLDSATLNVIMQQVKLEKINQQLKS